MEVITFTGLTEHTCTAAISFTGLFNHLDQQIESKRLLSSSISSMLYMNFNS